MSCSYASTRLGHSLSAIFNVVDFWVMIPCSLVRGYRHIGGRRTDTLHNLSITHIRIRLYIIVIIIIPIIIYAATVMSTESEFNYKYVYLL